MRAIFKSIQLWFGCSALADTLIAIAMTFLVSQKLGNDYAADARHPLPAHS